MKLKSLTTYLLKLNFFFFNFIEIKKFISFNFITCYSNFSSSIVVIFLFLKKTTVLKFTILADICVVDYPNRSYHRYEIVYNLLSSFYNLRLFIKFFLREADYIPTLTSIYSSSGWLEREAWDLYGIFFFKNPDLRRILTDYGFEYHPFRKDFPLTGYLELRYDDSLNSIVYEPVELAQEYRIFNFISPWELFH
jgi:NADH:ubiquinone oxidoreductase subunit C